MTEYELLIEIEELEDFVKNCSKEEARKIMIEAGISNPDGSLTERYK